jgi:glucosylceramidase
VNTSDVRHSIEGFGGCFNEKGWDALSVLSSAQRTKVLVDLFSPTGLRWGFNRMPIGSSDFADNYYSLDDSPGDFHMANLTLARDKMKLLPYIKAAMAVNPALQVWGSPWTGPEWLKVRCSAP